MTKKPTTETLFDTIKNTVLVPLHPAGFPFVAGAGFITLCLMLVSDTLSLIMGVLTLFCVYFFRDPVRVTPQNDDLVISPADGKVIHITENVALPKELGGENEPASFTKISIFLSVFDVHVNRIPVAGKIIKSAYNPGQFLNASLDKASDKNERASLLIETPTGQKLGVIQIAGLIARRIITDVTEGDQVDTGSRYGIIRFGSRADIYLPEGCAPLVCVGQRAIGGETVLGNLRGSEPRRTGKSH
jgi:phosphatidylserine decarboxylase